MRPRISIRGSVRPYDDLLFWEASYCPPRLVFFSNYRYKCKCKDFWGGLDCEMRMGTCASKPCGRRGLCVDDPNYPNFYQCLCNPGYENDVEALNQGANGQFCTKIKDLCKSNPCRNDATCLMIGESLRQGLLLGYGSESGTCLMISESP